MTIALMLMLAGPSVSPRCGALGTTVEINRCEGERYAASDRALNAQYRIALAKMKKRDAESGNLPLAPPSYTQALALAQRAWVQFRDANCLVYAYRVRGGTAMTAREAACESAMTIARTAELRDQVKGY